MRFNRITASDFSDGGTQLSFEFVAFKTQPDGHGVAVSDGTYITAGFPAGEWTQKEVADQLRKLADHMEKELDIEDAKRLKGN